jgi:acyl-CoA synthetase (AMP-forming)/AMP-acid ligase II
MIAALLAQAQRSPSVPFLLADDRAITYERAAVEARRLGTALVGRNIGRLAIHCHDSPKLVLLLAGCAAAACEACVLNRESSPAEVGELLRRLRIRTLVTDAADTVIPADASGKELSDVAVVRIDEFFPAGDCPSAADTAALPAPAADPGLMVLTTGTTGPAKAAVYAWASLVAQAGRRPHLAGTRWLLAYHLNHFAGLQVLVHVVVNGATLVIPRSPRVADAIAAIMDHDVEHVSATPTFWRFLLAEAGPEAVARLPIRQITLGGEAVPQDLIEILHRTFPEARISQVFATTEVGSCFSVRDLASGLPASLFERPDEAGVQMRVVDGELEVRSPHGMRGYDGEPPGDAPQWRATGDLVERRGDRYYFLGRKAETINVGGVKVHPPTVEEVVQHVPGVTAVRCYGRRNPVTGQIVAIDVLPAAAAETAALEDRIRAACAGLPRPAQPLLIRFVESLDTVNHKLMRRTS